VSVAVYRARSATEVVDGAIQLFRQNFAAFVTLGAIFYVPVAILNATIFGSVASSLPVTSGGGNPTLVGGDPTAVFAVYRKFAVFWPVFFAWTALWYAVIMTAISDAYLDGRVDIGSAFTRGTARVVPVIVGYFVKGLLVGIGFVFFIVPGVIIFLVLFAVPSATVLEGVGPIAGFGRSSELSRGLKGHIFTTYLLIFCLYIVAYLIILALAFAVGAAAKIALPLEYAARVAQLVSGLSTALVAPVLPIVGVLLYYDARIRKEGFDIELMSRSAPTTVPIPAV